MYNEHEEQEHQEVLIDLDLHDAAAAATYAMFENCISHAEIGS